MQIKVEQNRIYIVDESGKTLFIITAIDNKEIAINVGLADILVKPVASNKITVIKQF